MTAFSDAVLATQPVNVLAYWRCEETGGDLADASGNGQTLTLTGAGVQYGRLGADGRGLKMPGAARFDGTLVLPVVDALSAMAWVKRSTAAAFRNIMSAGDAANGFQIRLNNANHTIQVIRGDAAQCGASSVEVPLDGRWHSIFVTKAAATAPLIYLDGADVTAGGGSGTAWGSTTAFRLGARANVADRFWDDHLDEIAVWLDTSLTPGEIAALDALGSNALNAEDNRRRRR